jgi:Kef-type K+ transport system membrane component KefB
LRATFRGINPFPGQLLTFLAASVVISILAQFLGLPLVAACILAPAAVATGWTFAGHLITVDDDAPGEFSNPESDLKTWRESLRW